MPEMVALSRPYVSQIARCPAWVTIGQLWKGDAVVFNPTIDDIERWASHGIHLDDLRSGDGLQLHAWITLATGQIIEPTLMTTIASFHEHYRRFDGAVTIADADDAKPHRYEPLAVGGDIVEGIARRSSLPLLARNATELMMVGVVVEDPELG